MIRETALLLLSFAMTTGAMTTGAMAATTKLQDPSEPPQVMVLGTFHFNGGGQDMINPEVDDFLSDTRQAEIAEVLDRLEAYQPTKIFVELQPQYEERFNARYRAYRRGEHDLTVNERQQIGMRLASRMGHERLWGVDHQGGMDFAAMMGAAETAGQTRLLAEWDAFTGPLRARMEDPAVMELPILDRLISNNVQQVRDEHALYLLLAQMGAADNPAGVEEMTNWWARNMHIYANIARLAEPGDRVLVIYGSGHKYLLDQFVDEAPNLSWVDPLDYLTR
ncbi:DUF5694 domain-containing protein [Maricaulis sp.]|uniref:DUF5694 domain-containing protein n=1 Tax=Maricaulis sp. TaxID=1486257 RepID=UPI00260923B8|nr:DUF5694 domain-containing protein [Maricaulis sp.]